MPEAISKPFQHLRWSFFHEIVQAFPLWEKGMGGRGGGATTASIFESYSLSKQIPNGAPTPSKNEAPPLKLNIPLPLKNEVPFLTKTTINICVSLVKQHWIITGQLFNLRLFYLKGLQLCKITFFSLHAIVKVLTRFFPLFSTAPPPLSCNHVLTQALPPTTRDFEERNSSGGIGQHVPFPHAPHVLFTKGKP